MTNLFTEKPAKPRYGSFIERRSPQSKLHKTLAHAKSAIAFQWPWSGGIIYEYIDGDWREVYRKDPPSNCAKCNKPFDGKYYGHRRTFNYNDRKLDRIVVCNTCYDKHWGYRPIEPLARDWKPA